MFLGDPKIESLGSVDISGANGAEFIPGRSAQIKRVSIVMTTAQATASSVLTLTKRPTAGSSSGAISEGTMTVSVANGAAGSGVYFEPGQPSSTGTTESDGSLTYSGGALIALIPGESLYIVSDGGGSAGTGEVFVEYYEDGFDTTNMTEVTS